MAALGKPCGHGNRIWASKIRAINHDGRSLCESGADTGLLGGEIAVEVGLGPADGAGDMAHFVENGRTYVVNHSGVALDELVEVAERHAGDLSSGDGRGWGFDGLWFIDGLGGIEGWNWFFGGVRARGK